MSRFTSRLPQRDEGAVEHARRADGREPDAEVVRLRGHDRHAHPDDPVAAHLQEDAGEHHRDGGWGVAVGIG